METLRDHFVMSCINFQVSELLLQSSFETWLLLSCGSLSSIRDVRTAHLFSKWCTPPAPARHQLSHGNGHLDQDSRMCMFARLIVVRDPTGSDFDNKLLWVSVASFVSIPKVFL